MQARGNNNNDGYEDVFVTRTGHGCRIRVSHVYHPGSGSSSLFVMDNPTLELKAPNGGEEYYLGDTVEILWTSTQDESFVKIEFSIDEGASWKTIVDSTANDHLYEWTITDWFDAKWLLRISNTYEPKVNDVSDNMFTVVIHPDDQDYDTDGFTVNEGDCNDADDTIFPGAVEICDNKDNNCDGSVNEGLTCYAPGDLDEDGDVDGTDISRFIDDHAGMTIVDLAGNFGL